MGKITLKNKITQDKYTEYVIKSYDIQNSIETVTEIEYSLSEGKNFDWNIGVILGGSGSGKTTILKKLGTIQDVSFDDRSLISNFDWLSPEDASRLLSSMGLSSVPSWLRPYGLLSNGEQYRAKLAYLVGKAIDGEIILVDEFTSVVDRDVAKAMSFALQKYIRKHNKKIIVASCHYDILEWLMPDWSCNPQKEGGVLKKHDYLRRGRPQIELQISRTDSSVWNIFKQHHYLTADVNKSCKFFLFEWNGKPVAINAVISQPSGHFKNGVRESRIVVLPDYQGMGIGSKVSEITAAIYKNSGYKYFTKTIHPALGNYRNNNPDKWRPTRKNGATESAQSQMGSIGNWTVLIRTSYCHEYDGDVFEGYDELMLPTADYKKKKKRG